MEAVTVSSRDLSSAPTDVECDVCFRRNRRRAKQSCLECVASFCEDHVDLHNILYVGKKHKLVAATRRFQESICPEHDKMLEVFCRTDRQCICHLCITDKHKAHDVVSVKEEVAKKKIKLDNMQSQTTKMIQSHEKEEEELKLAIEAFKASAGEAVTENLAAFTELIQLLEKVEHTMNDLITSQERTVGKQVDELLQSLNLDIDELKKTDAELQRLKRLAEADNYILFLQNAFSVSILQKGFQVPALSAHPHCTFQLATEAVSDLITQLNTRCQWQFMTITERVKNTAIVSSPVPRTRQELLKYACQLTLDPNTMHSHLRLSHQNMELTAVRQSEDYPSHPDRFERRAQVLCKEGLRGSSLYWEVECGTKGDWATIAVSYKGIRRKGKKAPLFGRCEGSWALRSYGGLCEYWHNDKSRLINSPHCFTIGIYLDHRAGLLVFYNVSANMSIILKVLTKFTEPVYVGFGLGGISSTIRLCDLTLGEGTSAESKGCFFLP